MKREVCSACGSDYLGTVLDLGLSPIADNYTSSYSAIPHYPLQLAVCGGCYLVQLLEIVPDLFNGDYSFYSSASEPLSRYHESYASDVLNLFNLGEDGLKYKPFMVEIGSNDGDFSRHLVQAGWRVVGVDPAAGPAKVAEMRGVETIVKPFTRALAREIHAQQGLAGIVVANHVLAHVENVSDIFAGINELLAYNGTAYIEVQYLPDLLLNNAIDLIYHEHRNFFSLTSLREAAKPHGLHIIDAELTERQGGSLRVRLRRFAGSSQRATALRDSEWWLTRMESYSGLQGRAERLRERLRGLLKAERAAGRMVVGYGAPAKATTLLNFCDIDTELVQYVTDTTVAKQGRYIPGTGLEIFAPEQVEREPVDTYLLLAWNYAGPIMRKEQQFTIDGGHWIVPIPSPTLL